MTTFAKTFSASITRPIHLPRWDFLRLFTTGQKRRRATVDLIHSSPHLLRDIGVEDGRFIERSR